jgi:hypothetical protein
MVTLKSFYPVLTKFTVWSCGGQKENQNMVCYCLYLVHGIQHFEAVEHKLPVPGQLFPMSDIDFASQRKRDIPAVSVSEGWYKPVQTVWVKELLHVTRMSWGMSVSLSKVRNDVMLGTKLDRLHQFGFRRQQNLKYQEMSSENSSVSYLQSKKLNGIVPQLPRMYTYWNCVTLKQFPKRNLRTVQNCAYIFKFSRGHLTIILVQRQNLQSNKEMHQKEENTRLIGVRY